MQCLLLTALFAANHQVRLIQLVNQTCKSDYKISTPWIISYEIQCTIVYSFLSFTDTQFFSLLAKLWQSLVFFFLDCCMDCTRVSLHRPKFQVCVFAYGSPNSPVMRAAACEGILNIICRMVSSLSLSPEKTLCTLFVFRMRWVLFSRIKLLSWFLMETKLL